MKKPVCEMPTGKGYQLQIHYQGKVYSAAELAREVGIPCSTLAMFIRRNLPDEQELSRYIEDITWKKERGVPSHSRVYARVENGVRHRILTMDVVERTGMDRRLAQENLRYWEEGLIDDPFDRDAVYKAGLKLKTTKDVLNKGNAEWQALGDRVRSWRLERIPGGGRWERRMEAR